MSNQETEEYLEYKYEKRQAWVKEYDTPYDMILQDDEGEEFISYNVGESIENDEGTVIEIDKYKRIYLPKELQTNYQPN